MCGIFGYVGPKNPLETVFKGLKKLEYRGYDSAGIAGLRKNELFFWKEVGKLSELEKEISLHPELLDVAIGQTRWATHGGVTKTNAHPHMDMKKKMALVHNGIIENYEELKKELIREGFKFSSETDTEVIVHLIAKFYKGDLLKAVQQAIPLFKGAFAFTLVHADHPKSIVAVAKECPLVIGIGQGESFISSDHHAFAFFTKQVVYLSDGEIALIKADQLEIFNLAQDKIEKERFELQGFHEEVTKGAFDHYTIKEIFEQPHTLRSAILGRFIHDYGTATFDEIYFPDQIFGKIERVLILGCGTSFHAGLTASYMIEEMANLPVQVEISSEFRYKNPVIQPNTLVIAISQSGETADTIAALRELKAKGASILSLCNVYGSTIARESSGTIYLRAGPEIGVCSTKAFTSQLAILTLISLLLARMRHMPKSTGVDLLNALEQIPDQAKELLKSSPLIESIAKKYSHFQNFFFLGRHYMFPTALEGALKLKEISYINANGYPAGEMKHGPIALIGPDCPTVAFCGNKHTYSKMLSNLMEIKARNGKVIALAEAGSQGLEKIADDIVWLPHTIDPLAPILFSIAAQLLAYYIAKERGADIDQPKNLAKSVTVE